MTSKPNPDRADAFMRKRLQCRGLVNWEAMPRKGDPFARITCYTLPDGRIALALTYPNDGGFDVFVNNLRVHLDATQRDIQDAPHATEALDRLTVIARRIDDASGSPAFTAEEHDDLVAFLAQSGRNPGAAETAPADDGRTIWEQRTDAALAPLGREMADLIGRLCVALPDAVQELRRAGETRAQVDVEADALDALAGNVREMVRDIAGALGVKD